LRDHRENRKKRKEDMITSAEHCQYYYADLAAQTFPDTRAALPLRRYWWNLKNVVWKISFLGPIGFVKRAFPSTKLGRRVFKNQTRLTSGSIQKMNLGLAPGEWVEVKSLREIFATLDQNGKLKGLAFNREMAKFCGKRFKVYKRLEKMILESTGELRRIKTPTVMLEGVFCDGEAHDKCDRSCFCFWREAWLRRVASDSL
jgi:hypothetical protein